MKNIWDEDAFRLVLMAKYFTHGNPSRERG